jgi:xylulokinase
MKHIIACDLGTGGNKASLYELDGTSLGTVFRPYETLYPKPGRHEQRPSDWWDATVDAIRDLLQQTGVDPRSIRCIAISGHSLGCVPLDAEGNLLRQTTPVWSDSRPDVQPDRFFEHIDPISWYRMTGNGFPPPLYTAFKIMWYGDNEPDMYRQIDQVIGTKDYVNYRLTGRMATDFSYASGSGVYSLLDWDYSDKLLQAAGLRRGMLPQPLPSTEILGPLTAEAAKKLGLTTETLVAAGGVDNSCMALGAGNISPGRLYASLGSSIWIAVSSSEPLLDESSKPYVFTHVIPGMFTSAAAIFSGGSTLRWVRDRFCQNLVAQAEREGIDPYDLISNLAATSPVGSNGLLFNPSLAGGSALDASPTIRGALMGIDLSHSQSDIVRATLEGIALNLRIILDELRRLGTVGEQITVVGGGSRSDLWRQIMADAWEIDVVKTNVGQEAGSLGAAAVAAVGCGLWSDFARIDEVHDVQSVTKPDRQRSATYRRLLSLFRQASLNQARLGDAMKEAFEKD